MNKIINFIGKITGANKAWDVLNGYKTKIGAISLILSGASELLYRVSQIADFAGLLKLLKALPADQSWVAIMAGIAALGLGHKMEKAAPTEDQPK